MPTNRWVDGVGVLNRSPIRRKQSPTPNATSRGQLQLLPEPGNQPARQSCRAFSTRQLVPSPRAVESIERFNSLRNGAASGIKPETTAVRRFPCRTSAPWATRTCFAPSTQTASLH